VVDGARVNVRNVRGHLRAWVRVTDDVHRGVVVLPGKWWGFPEETGALANLLTPSAWTPGGQPAYNDTFVEVVGEQ
jgi:anaerobic selenocysteine-containing dehydrogenase